MPGKKRPAEFPTDWAWDNHHEALERELAGRKSRLSELEATEGAEDATKQQAKAEIAAVEAQLEHYGWGQRAAAKRPAGAAKSTRAK